MKIKNSKIILILHVFVLLTIMTACKPSVQNSDSLVGKWEVFITQGSGYGSDDKRIMVQMKRNGRCLQITSSTVSGMVHEKLKCTYEIRKDGRTWITFENGRVLQVGLKNNQLVLYNMFPNSGTAPHLRFDNIK